MLNNIYNFCNHYNKQGMNDRFKFRLWDSENKKMIFAPSKFSSSLGYAIQLDGRIYENGIFMKHLIINEWTGLTDRNGKEIYDGDYVNVTVPEANGLKEYTLEGQEIIWQKETASFAVGIYSHTMNDDLIYEVVGNKYEK